MSEPVKWDGANRLLVAPKNYTKEQIKELPVFSNGVVCVSKWRLSEEALKEVIETGCIFVEVLSGETQPPIFVGSEEECRSIAVDYGSVW
jgi:hypothetical protein